MVGPTLGPDGGGLAPGDLEFIINHVFLPPKLPQSDDTSQAATGELALIRSLLCSLHEFSSLQPLETPRLQPLIRMIERLLRVQTCQAREGITTEVFGELEDGESAVFYVEEQNAGLLLTGRADTILVQAFELLSDNGSVMSSKGCLVRQFPDVAAELLRARFSEQEFMKEFVDVLCKLATLPIATVRPKTRKARAEHDESRETVSPILVTGMVAGVLTGLGRGLKPTTVTKRMREQVNWHDTDNPFHRSPLWVLLRVSMLVVLHQDATQDSAHSLYKAISTFHHAVLVRKATEVRLGSDLRFTMEMKLLRRINKLNPSENMPWLLKTQEILDSSHDGLKRRWRAVQEKHKRSTSLSALSKLRFHADSSLRLQQLNEHLAWIGSRPSANVVDAGPGDDTKIAVLQATQFPTLSWDPLMQPFILLDFEAWVDEHLSHWVTAELAHNNQQHDTALVSIKKVESGIKEYLSLAKKLYTNDPEALSVMHLVAMELWVAMDQLAGDSIPLLLEFDPGFPPALLHPLILPTARQMVRLQNIEKYLAARKTGSYHPMFGNFARTESFAVRYFNARLHGGHHNLRNQIVATAERNQRQKLEEYRKKCQEYNMLATQLSQADHDQERNDYRDRWECTSNCYACSLDRRMKNIIIKKFEWPLPTNKNEAKAVVFEIDVPGLVCVWRNTTEHLFLSLLVDTEKLSGNAKLYYPTDHSGLRTFGTSTSSIQLTSPVEPVERSHYGHAHHITKFTERDICVEHGCRYDYYHQGKGVQPAEMFDSPRVHDRCSHAAHEPNDQLRKWIRCSDHTSNMVISALGHCDKDMPLEEFKAFGHVRAGKSTQWGNILGQLTMPSLDFNRRSTFFLFLQASTEAGPQDKLGSVHRKAHIDVSDEIFAGRFLGALEDAFSRVRKNWQNDVVVGLLACLTIRILSLSSFGHISERALRLLAEIRLTSMMWARDLLSKRDDSPDDEERQALAQRALMASLVCMSTFDIDLNLLRQLLSSQSQLSHFVKCATMARNNLPSTISDPVLRFFTHRWRSVMHRSMVILREEVTQEQNFGLCSAIQEFWADYSPSPRGWSTRQEPEHHILQSSLSRSGKRTSVTWNMLTGQLLVNGYPLSRLPRDFELDPSYHQLFGERVLEVMPSTFGDMHFSASRDQQGWVVHFSKISGHLVTQAVKRKSDTNKGTAICEDLWEFIPQSHFSRDLPASFIKGFSHWRNMRTGTIEFRPVEKPWNHSPDHWMLVHDGGRRMLRQGQKYVVDPHSETANSLWARLKPIESKENVDIIFHDDVDARSLEILLPRFSLTFSLVAGESSLRSKHYAGMIVDEHQEIDTLIGLENMLVLRDENCATNISPSRLVLIPRGQTRISLTQRHVCIEIESSEALHIKHDAFKVDTRLGQLADNGSLSSKLFLCLLHALTSHCLPDPLSSRTGTEEALRILRSAAVCSFQRLDTVCTKLLRDISELSPKRAFYPTHLTNMEQCDWNESLPVLSQHDGFRAVVEGIVAHAENCELLYVYKSDKGGIRKEITELARDVKSHLLVERAIIRNSVFRVSEFGAEEYSSAHDVAHSGRHHTHQSAKLSCIAQGIASRVHSGNPQLLHPITDNLQTSILSTTGKTFSGSPTVSLRLRSRCFEKPEKALNGDWCGLHRALATEENSYRVIFFLSSLAFATKADPDLVQALLAISTHRDMFSHIITPPDETNFDLDYSSSMLLQKVKRIVEESRYPMRKCPERYLGRWRDENKRDFQNRRYKQWYQISHEMSRSLLSELESQWSGSWTVVASVEQDWETYFNINSIIYKVNEVLNLTRRTELFSEYLDNLVREIKGMSCLPSSRDAVVMSPPHHDAITVRRPAVSGLGFINGGSLFSHPAPQTHRPTPETFSDLLEEIPQAGNGQQPIATLIEHLSSLGTKQQHHVSYIGELQQSSESVGTAQLRFRADETDSAARFSDYLDRCRREIALIEEKIRMAMEGNSVAERLCGKCDFYPRVSPIFLLHRLRRNLWEGVPAAWRDCLTNYALSLAYLQRAERLVNSYGLANRQVDFLKELRNSGDHSNEDCDPLDYPEHLLLEVEQGILIRPVQHQIAAKMRNPPGGQSSVMQLNMGEGKSSVIVPIVSLAIADGTRLARVVVAKAQANQMMHTLVAAVGGLLGRRVFYLPISRGIRFDNRTIGVVRHMIQQCKIEGGVLLTQPEHILSFKLMGLEGIWNKLPAAQEILTTYEELERLSRDIVDESDENFSVKFELIYTMGSQKPVDMSPDRWVFIQDLMDVVKDVARALKHGDCSSSASAEGLLFEEEPQSGRFPTIRTLDETTGTRLIKAIADKLCSLGMRGFPLQHQNKQMRDAVLQYILDPNVGKECIERVKNEQAGLFGEDTMRRGLFLLRGLLASGVLQFALGQKRFRVNYGLAPDRQPPTMLAVPYRAKDSPAPRSEFSHTDVVIILTCLSYYYRGLTDEELFTSLEMLSNSDRSEQEYASWSQASPLLPPTMRHFSAVNLKDKTLCQTKLFPKLRFSKPTIDYYLSNVVFPKEMREFPFKLSSSGWDLANPKTHPLTGFSGTTDSKYVLPLPVTALDLPEQRHTNSFVLACLLRSENTVLELDSDQDDLCALTVDMLLSAVTHSNKSMRVILDVGAQIIELSNLQFAKLWLEHAADAEAVIFFDGNDELSVVTRNGVVESFYTSPFRTQTERCLVFLDQAHTRGTDLRLPDSYRAAVTLGPGVTKDTLVQACMRMRKLGNGQSVTFCLSPEMQKRIRDFGQMDPFHSITVMHILSFAIYETWDDAHRSVPLWATQGLRHQRQEEIVGRAGGYYDLKPEDVKEYLEDEAQTLEMRYQPASTGGQSQSLSSQLEAASDLTSRQADVAAIKRKCVEFGFSNLDTVVTLEEEQERELAPEIEQERHVERPAPMEPLLHVLDPDVQRFVNTGVLQQEGSAFLPAFHAMSQSSASQLFPADQFPCDLLITSDFARTVKGAKAGYCSDSYQRPVQWILTSRVSERSAGASASAEMHIVIISPYEADVIKSDILRFVEESPVTLHAYLPRSSLSFRTMEDLKTFTYPPVSPSRLEAWTAPPELIMQLNLFAGQLYLRSYEEYVRLCRYLGLSCTENESDGSGGVVVGADGFVGKAGGEGYEDCPFERSPVGFLSVLYKRLRRDCTNIDRTHMGTILAGGILTERDFEWGGDVKDNGGLEEMVERLRLD